ncbi:hypothetical protein J3A83DRAFT_4367767 [Scleroderma citrinum]
MQLRCTFGLRATVAFLVVLVNFACILARLPSEVDNGPKVSSSPGDIAPPSNSYIQEIELRQTPPAIMPSSSSYPIIQSQNPNPQPQPLPNANASHPSGPPQGTNTITSTSIPLYGQSTTTPTYSVNLTPFGGSLIPSVPHSEFSSVRITTSSTAGFPALTGYPICVSMCLAHAAFVANCTSVIAVNCYCSNPEFPPALVNCTAQACLINLYAAEYLAQQYCNLAGYSDAPPGPGGAPVPPTPLSFPSPPSTPPPPTFPTSITPVQIITGAATPISGSVHVWDGSIAKGMWMSMAAGLFGGAVGALLV